MQKVLENRYHNLSNDELSKLTKELDHLSTEEVYDLQTEILTQGDSKLAAIIKKEVEKHPMHYYATNSIRSLILSQIMKGKQSVQELQSEFRTRGTHLVLTLEEEVPVARRYKLKRTLTTLFAQQASDIPEDVRHQIIQEIINEKLPTEVLNNYQSDKKFYQYADAAGFWVTAIIFMVLVFLYLSF